VDLEPVAEHPPWALFGLALVVALLASLASDAILVAIGMTIFPSVRDFPHFQFSDYGKLTVIGVTIAWPGLASRDPNLVAAALAISPPGGGGDPASLGPGPVDLGPR
jgi:hypothetical protein